MIISNHAATTLAALLTVTSASAEESFADKAKTWYTRNNPEKSLKADLDVVDGACDPYIPSFTLMGLNNFTNPWPPQCTYDPEQLLGDAKLDPANDACWCIPEGLSEGCCPDPGERPIDYGWQVAEAYLTHEETSEPIKLNPPGCDPWYGLYDNDGFAGNITGMTGQCDDLASWEVESEDPVCAFVYPEEDMEEDGTCGPQHREYELKTYASFEDAEEDGAVVTHYGACGVCSNAQDLAVIIDPRTVYDGTRGNCAANNSTKDLQRILLGDLPDIKEGEVYGCYRGMGFTEDCSYVQATGDIIGGGVGGKNCTTDCLIALGNGISPNKYDDCELNDCLSCEKDARETIDYYKWQGRFVENSGLVMYNPFYHVKYDCDYYLEENKIIKQDPYAKANTKEADPPSKSLYSGDATIDTLEPSVSIQLNQENCLYDFKFSFKHDERQPHAGGWDESLTNGVSREEFEKHCSKEDPMIAKDGLPYRDRRKFTYYFEDDVKEITGIFDHMSIDFNPCGHHDEIYFGRPHYDMHMYTVPEYWRDIMQCDVTSCDYQDCKYDVSQQTTEVGRAFFETDICREEFPQFVKDNIPDGVGVQPGSFNKNMPFGFVLLSHTGNPRSGIHSINAAVAQGWNDTQVERWEDPVMFMMSFDKLITVYEPMIPVEFAQGDEAHFFQSMESPPLCKTNMGLPLTYTATYNNVTKFTTFNYLGESPKCMCEKGLKSEEDCAANDAEMAAYDATWEKYKGDLKKPGEEKEQKKMIGNFAVQDIEAAFGMKNGSLKYPKEPKSARTLKGAKKGKKGQGEPTYEDLLENNFWTDLIGTPTVLNRFLPITPTLRSTFMQEVAVLGKPFFENQKDMYSEHVTLGCFYRPKSPENVTALVNDGLDVCTDLVPAGPGDPAGIAGFQLEWYVAGFVDEYTRLMYIGNDVGSVQFMTEFVLIKISDEDELLIEGEDFGYTISGPNYGEYAFYQTPSIVQETDFYGNIGKIFISQVKVDLDEPCPEEYCGTLKGIDLLTGAPLAPEDQLLNPYRVDGVIPWPQPILDQKCELFPCASLDDCDEPEEGTCGKFMPPAPKATKKPKESSAKKGKKTKAPEEPVTRIHKASNCKEMYGNEQSKNYTIRGFSMAEVEEAFKLETGSLTTKADAETFDCFLENYSVAYMKEFPFSFGSLDVLFGTTRSIGIKNFVTLAPPMLEISSRPAWAEYFSLGCAYSPKPPFADSFINDVLQLEDLCGDSSAADWNIEGFIDDFNMIMRFSIPDIKEFADNYMTQLVKFSLDPESLTDTSFTIISEGPTGGAYEGYKSIPANLATSFDSAGFPGLLQSNMGKWTASMNYLDFSEDCPDKFCKNFINSPPGAPGAIGNFFPAGLTIPNPNHPEFPPFYQGESLCNIWEKAYGCPDYEFPGGGGAKSSKKGKKGKKGKA